MYTQTTLHKHTGLTIFVIYTHGALPLESLGILEHEHSVQIVVYVHLNVLYTAPPFCFLEIERAEINRSLSFSYYYALCLTPEC